MSVKNAIRVIKKPIVVGGIVFLLTLLFVQAFTYQRYLILKSQRTRELTNAVREVKERIESALSESHAAANALSVIVKKYGVNNDFNTVAKKDTGGNSNG